MTDLRHPSGSDDRLLVNAAGRRIPDILRDQGSNPALWDGIGDMFVSQHEKSNIIFDVVLRTWIRHLINLPSDDLFASCFAGFSKAIGRLEGKLEGDFTPGAAFSDLENGIEGHWLVVSLLRKASSLENWAEIDSLINAFSNEEDRAVLLTISALNQPIVSPRFDPELRSALYVYLCAAACETQHGIDSKVSRTPLLHPTWIKMGIIPDFAAELQMLQAHPQARWHAEQAGVRVTETLRGDPLNSAALSIERFHLTAPRDSKEAKALHASISKLLLEKTPITRLVNAALTTDEAGVQVHASGIDTINMKLSALRSSTRRSIYLEPGEIQYLSKIGVEILPDQDVIHGLDQPQKQNLAKWRNGNEL